MPVALQCLGWKLGSAHIEWLEPRTDWQGSASTQAKRIVVMSPHPDDDVISMGGTLARLCQQGHEVSLCAGTVLLCDTTTPRFHVTCVCGCGASDRKPSAYSFCKWKGNVCEKCLCTLQVHVAYQTSGCIAVHDHDALRHLDFMRSFAEHSGTSLDDILQYEAVQRSMHCKKPGEVSPASCCETL